MYLRIILNSFGILSTYGGSDGGLNSVVLGNYCHILKSLVYKSIKRTADRGCQTEPLATRAAIHVSQVIRTVKLIRPSRHPLPIGSGHRLPLTESLAPSFNQAFTF